MTEVTKGLLEMPVDMASADPMTAMQVIGAHKAEIASLREQLELCEETKTALTKQAMEQQEQLVELGEQLEQSQLTIKEMSEDPGGEYYTGLACGVEDRDIYDRYEAAEYGWQSAFEYVASCAPEIPEPKEQ